MLETLRMVADGGEDDKVVAPLMELTLRGVNVAHVFRPAAPSHCVSASIDSIELLDVQTPWIELRTAVRGGELASKDGRGASEASTPWAQVELETEPQPLEESQGQSSTKDVALRLDGKVGRCRRLGGGWARAGGWGV